MSDSAALSELLLLLLLLRKLTQLQQQKRARELSDKTYLINIHFGELTKAKCLTCWRQQQTQRRLLLRKQLRFGKTEKCDLKLRQKRSVYKTFVSLSFSSELCPKSRRQRQIACARAMVLIANRFRFESFVFVFLFFFGWRRQPQAASFSRPQASRSLVQSASERLTFEPETQLEAQKALWDVSLARHSYKTKHVSCSR